MTPGTIIGGVSLVMLAGLLAWAAVSDLRHYAIPNRISLGILLGFPVFALSTNFVPAFYPSVNWFGALIVAVSVLAAGLVLFTKGILGGGDVKLLTTTSLWAGPSLIFDLLAVTALAGGLIALGFIVRGITQRHRGETAVAMKQLELPYGVAIAAGGLFVACQLLAGMIG